MTNNNMGLVLKALNELISNIPQSNLSKSNTPEEDAKKLIAKASWKAAGTSGLAAAVPGPFGFVTIIPELFALWKIQAQLVADIAAVFGKTKNLTKESMIYCLFKHGGSHLFNEFIIRVGERVLIKRTSLRVMQTVLKKIGLRITQKFIGNTISRFLPLIGSITLGAYAKYDTKKIGSNTIEFFKMEIETSGPVNESGDA